MSRLSYALLVVSGLSFLSGCQTDRFAGLSRQDAVSTGVPDPAVDLDPRVARLQDRKWFKKSEELPEEFVAAKQGLKNATNLYEKLAEYHVGAAVSQNNPALLEKARQKYTTLLKDDPNSLNAMLGLANVDLKADRIGDAEKMYKTVLARFPNDSTALAAVAGFYNDTERPQEVLRLLPEAVRRDPENRGLRNQMGLALVRTGNPEAAVPHFTKVEGQASAYATIGSLLAKTDPQAAETYIRRAIDRNPDLDKAKQALASLTADRMERSSGEIRQVSGRRAVKANRRLQRASDRMMRR